MTGVQKPHSVLDEARALIAGFEDLGVVEQMRHGDEWAHDAVELLKSLIEQLEAARRERSELAQRARSYFIDYEDDCPHPVAMFLDDISVDPAAPNPAKGPRCICINDGPYHTERVNPDCPVHAPASEPRNRPGAGWQEHTLCVCGGYEAGDHHFDRSLCACGAMHYYCNRCGSQGDSCDSDPASRSGS